MTHVMLDIETLGTGHDAAILSIGAVKFDPAGPAPDLGDALYVPVDVVDCVRRGLRMDPQTVIWWMSDAQAPARTRMMQEKRIDLSSALDGFAQWFGTESLPVWGNGATFDNVIMRTAFNAVGLPCPWSFRHDRCYRTLNATSPGLSFEPFGTHHNAVDDAMGQALHLQKIVALRGLTLA